MTDKVISGGQTGANETSLYAAYDFGIKAYPIETLIASKNAASEKFV